MTTGTNKIAIVEHLIRELINRRDRLETEGSGYSLVEIISFEIEVVKCAPLLHIGCPGRIDISEIPNHKFILDIKNNDDFCFLWASDV